MRTLTAGFVGVLGLLAVVPPAVAKDCKIGYIEVPRLLEEFEGFKDARKDLDKTRADREEEFGRRAKLLSKEAQDIKEGARLLSPAKQKEKEAAFNKKAQELEEWRQTQNKELQEREEGLVKRLESDVRKTLETVGADGKFSFVVRKDLMLYMDADATDLTDRVLAALRKQAATKGK